MVDLSSRCQLLCLHVPLLVDFRELSQCQRLRSRGLEPPLIECSSSNGSTEFIESHPGRRLAMDFAVGPFRKADAHATEAAPPGMFAAITLTTRMLADLVKSPIVVTVRSS